MHLNLWRGLHAANAPQSTLQRLQQCCHALLEQQRKILNQLENDQYTQVCSVFGASVGGHIRHSLDHLRLALMSGISGHESSIDAIPTLHYDKRERKTNVEVNVAAALSEIQELLSATDNLDAKKMDKPVVSAFMLSADGQEQFLKSTIERELAFSCHHCIHHHAMIKQILQQNVHGLNIPANFGLAPSTENYEKTCVEK